MFLLTVIGPFVSALGATIALPKTFTGQFNHAYGGFTLWDIVMPAGSRAVELADPWYSWWFTIPMFGAMTLCGAEATRRHVLAKHHTPPSPNRRMG